MDASHPHRPKCMKVNRPLSEGVKSPTDSNYYNSFQQWKSHKFSPDEDAEEGECFYQQHDPKSVPTSAPTATTPAPTTSQQPQDRIPSAAPSAEVISKDILLQSIGFMKPDKLLRHLDIIGNGTVKISNLTRNPKVDPGEAASIRAKKKNTVPQPPRKHYSDLWHMDIGYGPCSAIGGIKYTLLFVDSHSRYKYVYPLKNLKTSLLRAVKRFFKDVKVKPKLIRTDFDNKLMYGMVGKYIQEEKQVDLESSPPYRQHQNGLVERAWQTAVTMCRNWLTSSLLPTKYWWWGIKRSIEIMNILPTSHLRNTVATPHELAFGTKADYRVLFPMFSVAYLKQEREQGGTHKNKFRSRSLKCIIVGSDTKSNGYLFYHPPSKQLLSGNNGHRLDTFMPSGPQFQETFDGNFTFNTRGSMDAIHRPLAHDEGKTVYFQAKDKSYVESKIISAPIDDENEPYTVQIISNGDIHDIESGKLFDHNPTITPTNPSPTSTDSILPTLPWIKHDAKTTLWLPTKMKHPKQGRLKYTEITDTWSFSPGQKDNHPHIPLPNFVEIAQSMVTNKKLFNGW